MDNPNTLVGRVAAVALKPEHGGAMREVPAAHAEKDGGLTGSVKPNPKRGITLLARGHWLLAQRELGGNMPWHTRRANVLIDAESIGHLRGRTIRIGAAQVNVIAETRPCELMDQLQPGLLAALKPDCRAGVYGRVVQEGEIRIGDEVRIIGDCQETKD